MFRFLPWKFIVKHAARRYGVLDPASFVARIRGFAQPSEVGEPLELLRAGIVFHARGLVNAKAIQHNLDWVWPFWVEKQFNPRDPSFVPRAFSFSHINLTHRNWTAVGMPGVAAYPIVDPRGLVTPLHDGWSLDFWVVTESRRRLLPSKAEDAAVTQRLVLDPTLLIETKIRKDDITLDLTTKMVLSDGKPEVCTEVCATANEDGWVVVAVRPYNPEGVQFINRIGMDASGTAFRVNDESTVKLGEKPDSLRMAHYAEGDVYLDLPGSSEEREVTCDTGMATAAALFRLHAGQTRVLGISATLERDTKEAKHLNAALSWQEALKGTSALKVADGKVQFLYDAAVRTMLLLSAEDLVPGPYTYRRFWFRDACLMLHPMLAIGMVERAKRVLAEFPAKQLHNGYFLSQEGEWDSNGQVLWIAARYAAMTGQELGAEMEEALRKGVRWLAKKRLEKDEPKGTKGLLPAGFSAEHLGPNDYYYWDDFWAWGGLKAMAEYWRKKGGIATREAEELGKEYEASIEASLAGIPAKRSLGAMPAAPGRRMDAGAIGSMVADYPLMLYPAGETRLMKTVDFLMERCFQQGGFFQEMIHSGVNAYLTLDLAQTLLRAGDPRFADLIRRVAELATPTGQWPEAIHPLTLGGCMGDGQHGWAAAEWVMMIRNCFVREEAEELVIGSGILKEWGDAGFGPTLTAWGPVLVRLEGSRIFVEGKWRGAAPWLRVEVPGFAPVRAEGTQTNFELEAR
ncbi:hypothetical protein [Luteolibacter sp. Populi]|uniref:hypothetical protein n=1 Tax=Luteolibacter sp. Populi TaxID=3230487 RepID=UPI0034660D0A